MKSMIKKFKTIKSLAVFRDFSWDKHVISPNNEPDEFKKINILYGRNYSGKTTLSRIIRALETGVLSPNYAEPQFSVLWDDNTETTNSPLQTHGKAIRVFNEDFVRENLSFLMDTSGQNGEVKPFAVIGADNVKIEEAIKKIKTELGSEEAGKETGLFAQLKVKQGEESKAKNEYETAKEELDKKKRTEATQGPDSIKQRHSLFGDINYTITKLDRDIGTVLASGYTPIGDAKRQELEASLIETPKQNIPALSGPPLLFRALLEKTKECVERKIGGSEKIQELVRNYALNEWVKEGRKLHKNKRTVCAFCGGTISDERWAVLEKHFDEETGKLENNIDSIITEIKNYKQFISTSFNVSKDAFYTKFQSEVDALISEYKTASKNYDIALDVLIEQLEKRKKEITVDFTFSAPSNVPDNIVEIHRKYEEIRQQSNKYTDSLTTAKKNAQEKLRLHEVRTWCDKIEYTAETKKIEKLDAQKIETENARKKVDEEIKEKEREIENLKRKLNDEEKGAVKVNEYLNHFFGHQFLTLRAITNTDVTTEPKQIRFEIMRGDQKAFNLSEGECSLIAFCYFMAKLNDAVTSDKKPIIWIDDPISSLDGNHIFFVYSLMRSEIIDKERFDQLFVSTHNLEFLKYLKRLRGKDATKDRQQNWFVVEHLKESSVIRLMPQYLKNYITEFNYLFHQIFKCSKAENIDDENYEIFYNFGNNARKFMEIYLYYKFPDGVDDNSRLSRFLGDEISRFLVDRVENEQSHLSGSFERGALPVNIPEIKTVASRICQEIEKTDKAQYDALLNSIG
jgi:wobble nucleotide-excising tRNase